MLERYEVTVKLTGGSVHNFNNADGTECSIGNIIKFNLKAHNYENALKTAKRILNYCHVKYELV